MTLGQPDLGRVSEQDRLAHIGIIATIGISMCLARASCTNASGGSGWPSASRRLRRIHPFLLQNPVRRQASCGSEILMQTFIDAGDWNKYPVLPWFALGVHGFGHGRRLVRWLEDPEAADPDELGDRARLDWRGDDRPAGARLRELDQLLPVRPHLLLPRLEVPAEPLPQPLVLRRGELHGRDDALHRPVRDARRPLAGGDRARCRSSSTACTSRCSPSFATGSVSTTARAGSPPRSSDGLRCWR